MKVLISGASGLIGTALKTALSTRDDQILALARRTAQTDDEITWDPSSGSLDASRLNNLDAVVHLAGENIAAGRWTPAQKARIRDSRVQGTNLLARTIARLSSPPKVFISASAIGYYGHRDDEILTEDSAPGDGFLPEVCTAWEKAAKPAIEAGIRTVHPRIGIVLSPKGGALAKMRLPFKLGLGGIIGSGTQYMSWITLDDLISFLLFSIDNDTINGPINAVSPTPVTNREYTKTLGRVLSRPTIFPLPAFAARLALGEMADALLLSSARVLPTRLESLDFSVLHTQLDPTLRFLLNR
jgi:uncharacterized protein (TIGR01777 family)